MSLGFTRDSIADLQKLYNTTEQPDDTFYTTAPKSSSNVSSNDKDIDDFLFFDDDNEDDNGFLGGGGGGGVNVNVNVMVPIVDDQLSSTTPFQQQQQQQHHHIHQKKTNNEIEEKVMFGHEDDNENRNQNSDNQSLDVMYHHKQRHEGVTGHNGNLFNSLKNKKKQKVVTHPPSTNIQEQQKNGGKKGTDSKNDATTHRKTSECTVTTVDSSTITINNVTTETMNPSYYSGFDYSSYEAEYNFSEYKDPYAPNTHLDLHQKDSSGKKILCCLFPKHCDEPDESDDEDDYYTDEPDDEGQDETNDQSNVQLRRTLSTTVSATNNAKNNNSDEKVVIHEDDSSDSDLSMDKSNHGIDVFDDDLSLELGLPASMEEQQNGNDGRNANNSTSLPQLQQQQQVQQQQQLTQSSSININKSINQVTDLTSTSTSTLKTANSTVKTLSPPPPPQQPHHSEHLEKKPLKGILKRTITKPDPSLSSSTKMNNTKSKQNDPGGRRSILPSYQSTKLFEEGNGNASNRNNKGTTSPEKAKGERKGISFSPMARVINVTARSEMSYFVRSLIWWQKNDYDDFKKTGRIISQAMLCGGSEIWLQTSNAWGNKIGNTKGHSSTKNNNNSNSTSSPAYDEAHMKALKKYGVTISNEDDEEKDEDVGSKWWCKFGHSRRGLEHVVCIEEGRQRQRFVNTAVRAVLDEQRRQRITRKDPNKIASVAMQYTSWARDLAIASGAADAEAVKSNFDSKAKCRIQHLRRGLLNAARSPTKASIPSVSSVQEVHIPSASFVLAANSVVTAEVLDANTHGSLRMKHLKKKKVIVTEEEKKSSGMEENAIAKKAAGFQF